MVYEEYEYEILSDIEAEVRQDARFVLIEFQSSRNGLVRLIHDKINECCYWINPRGWCRNADTIATDLAVSGNGQNIKLGDDFIRHILTYGYLA